MSPLFPKILHQRQRAFTLVETVLALGIASFALVSVMGLLPCGLQVFRNAMDLTLEGQMAQYIVGKVSQTPYEDYGKLPVSYRFDNEGNFVPQESADGIYTASLALNPQTSLPGSMSFTNDGLTGVTITFKRQGETGPVRASKTFVTYIDAKSRLPSP